MMLILSRRIAISVHNPDYYRPARWPFDLARVHLTYGERLHRDRATSDARRHLSAARDIFNQLGAAPWAARANSELRATGQPVGHDQRPAPVTLTPQQREIATLAAAGLTNKQPVPVAPHGRHTPVPGFPEARRPFEGGTTRRIVQQRRSRGDGPVALTRRPALSATPLAAASPSSCVLASVLLGRHMARWGRS